MKKPQLKDRYSSVQYTSYIVGFVLSVVTTLVAYFLVVNKVLPTGALIWVVLAIAVVQLLVQMVFFLHIGRGSQWKTVTLLFTVVIVLILVVGTVWVMQNLDYNMMHMTPEQMRIYMSENEGI